MRFRRQQPKRRRTWWRNSYGAITDGQFEIFRETPKWLRENHIPAWSPWALYDMRSGVAVHVDNFTTVERAKGYAELNPLISQPEEAS
jgi:hypothetical protein